MAILESINNVYDLKKLNISQLEHLSSEIRELLVSVVSLNGGHLASNLGVVELTIALHYVFDCPKDKFIFDVGHQSYVHKILTDRKNVFKSLRQQNGISGFLRSEESDFDCYDTGHSSTAISVGCGFMRARNLTKENYEIISIVGDGALTGGMCYEAFNDLGNINGKQIIVINDNTMAISETVGNLSKLLNSKHKCFVDFLDKLNIECIEDIDGHNLKELIEIFEKAKETDKTIVLNVKTIKGKGLEVAEKNPMFYHGVPNKKSSVYLETFSKVAGLKLAELAEMDNKICAVTAAMGVSVGLTEFANKFPERYFDVSIAEEHAVTMCGGLAKSGFKPYFMVYSTFLQRGFDQIIHDICIQNLPVTFLIDRAGLVCDDGETHQGIFDVSYLNLIPNMTILSPKDTTELKNMLKWSKDYNSPLAIRYPKGNVKVKYKKHKKFNLDWEFEIDNNRDFVVVTHGSRMMELATTCQNEIVNDDFKFDIVNARVLKPLDKKILEKLKNKKIIVLEDNVLNGGLATSIMNYYSKSNMKVNIKAIGIKDKFPTIGTIKQLQNECELNNENIIKTIQSFKNKNS